LQATFYGVPREPVRRTSALGRWSLTGAAFRMYRGGMMFNRTIRRAAFRRRSFDDDGLRRVRRQR
jgi:hypothetical protein